MIKAKINDKTSFELEKKNGKISLNGKDLNLDLSSLSDRRFHILKDNKSYRVEIIKSTSEEKAYSIKVNGHIYQVELEDKYDRLLKDLGMANLGSAGITNLKAPMPGMVLEIIAKEGDVVQKGDPILILEAMKMENMIKAPGDATIKAILIQQGVAVERNQILIEFE